MIILARRRRFTNKLLSSRNFVTLDIKKLNIIFENIACALNSILIFFKIFFEVQISINRLQCEKKTLFFQTSNLFLEKKIEKILKLFDSLSNIFRTRFRR